MYRFLKALTVTGVLAALGACANIDDLSKPPKPIGEFALSHNVVIAPNLVKGPVSREGSKEEWIAAVDKAINDRFSRFDGDQLYHFGISLEGYVLAQPGLPVVLSPKSALILRITVWDDAAGVKLNEEPEQLTVLESLDGDTVIGSGLTKTGEEQMEALAVNAAKLIQRWITRQHAQEGWFKRDPAKVRIDANKAKAEPGIAEKTAETTEAAEGAVKSN